ncbi:hypothetical protein N658DRAFT_231378 [Parathielavia hyrcaniae]|uniref:Uncharacterized protein n=1 Tax=Parathielavia hyrcaniae TaxID=113614 RepID=A0AAN6Q589_9PEZI|nr:hypothetical protein N658DRAFT_231378 [Parathielavia hyrcaniae]
MASAGYQNVPRDAESGANGNLTTGAIAGIACGAGALFLGAAGLFVVYWRRQRQFEREDNSDADSFDEGRPPANMAPAVAYTMDYKMDNPQHHEGDHASSYTYSPEKSSYTFSPLNAPDVATAMPTHPAYIPRALVRGSTTPSNRSTATTSPPPIPSPPFPVSSSNSKTQPDDASTQASRSAAEPNANPPRESHSSPSGLPAQPAAPRHRPTQSTATNTGPFTSPPHSASSTDGNSTTTKKTTSKRKPRSFPPPPLNLLNNSAKDKPLSGKESTTISGPLAFPQHHHHQYLAATQGAAAATAAGSQHNNTIPNKSKSGWTREDDMMMMMPTTSPENDLFGYDGDETAGTQSQSEGRRTFRSRLRDSWGAGGASGASGGGGGGAAGESSGEKKGKKHNRNRSDRNSGGNGGGGGGSGGGLGGGNRHYAEIEIGRGSDIW